MSNLIAQPTIWKFDEVPEEIQKHFIDSVMNMYYFHAKFIDHNGRSYLPIIHDIVTEMRYYWTIESHFACERDGVPFKENYFYNKYITPLSESEQGEEEDWFNRAYGSGVFCDTQQVLEKFYFAYHDSYESRYSDDFLYPIVEVW